VIGAYPRLDVLLNNVGGFWAHRHVTADGLEHTFALNHLAPFLLTNLLLDRLAANAPARVITVSSGAQSMGRIDFDDLMGEGAYSGQRAYNQSKLANVMFTYELARRLEGTGVTANALHPGVTDTSFSAEDPARAFAAFVGIMRPFMLSPQRGAETPVYLASSPEVNGVSGRYFADRRARTTNKASYDTETTARLWQVSAELVGLSRPS
jgi:retinol dehydrogenase-14